MLAGKITAVTYGRENRVTIEMEGEAREFTAMQRVLVTIIPDDTQVQRSYDRGKADGIQEERWALEEHLRRDRP